MPAIDDIAIDMTIVLGSAKVPIRQILKMGRGAMIPLDANQEDPTLVYVHDVLVAKGKVLVREEALALEITHIVRRDGR